VKLLHKTIKVKLNLSSLVTYTDTFKTYFFYQRRYRYRIKYNSELDYLII